MKKRYSIFIMLACLACKHKTDVSPDAKPVPGYFSNVVILGNSITSSPADASLGWYGNWGMAATAPQYDYVHLLTGKLDSVNSSCKVQTLNVSAFERDFTSYDFDASLKVYRDSKPDLLILRIGENVPLQYDSVSFAKRYQMLIDYMKTSNPGLKVLSVGSFFLARESINGLMSKFPPYLSLAPVGNDITNYAFNMVNADYGVKIHPGDKGMRVIADSIWHRLEKMY